MGCEFTCACVHASRARQWCHATLKFHAASHTHVTLQRRSGRTIFPQNLDPGRKGSSELQRCCVDHSSHIYGPISGLPVRIFQIDCAVVLARCDSYPYGSPHSVNPTFADSTSRPILASEPLRDRTESDPLWHGELCVLEVDYLRIALALAE